MIAVIKPSEMMCR